MKTLFVAGHQGMVGVAILRQLEKRDAIKIITRSRSELDLTSQEAVSQFFIDNKIDEVYLADAKVGGIHANHTYPAEFIYENLMIEANIIHSAHSNDVQKLLFQGQAVSIPNWPNSL
jgi:GDP-L-fucose synthase